MKSIQNQYNQLLEGNLSQANFMRAVRMTFPQYVTNVTSFNDSVKILKNKGILSEAKEYQCNPVELAMGIKVEMEHTDDPKKAEKIAMDHLKENPSYYSQLKLSGIDSHQELPKEKSKTPKSPKKGELVDKENGLKIVKESQEELNEYGWEYVRGSNGNCYKVNDEGERIQVADHYCGYNEARLNMFPGEEPNEAAQQAAKFIEMNNTLKPFSSKFILQNGGKNSTILRYGYWEKLPSDLLGKFELQFDVVMDEEDHDDRRPTISYMLTPKRPIGKVDVGAAFEKFKATLEGIVREVLEEENSK
jgi:hypothetical protein